MKKISEEEYENLCEILLTEDNVNRQLFIELACSLFEPIEIARFFKRMIRDRYKERKLSEKEKSLSDTHCYRKKIPEVNNVYSFVDDFYPLDFYHLPTYSKEQSKENFKLDLEQLLFI